MARGLFHARQKPWAHFAGFGEMRYHFHDFNGHEHTDESGIELASLEEAKTAATRLLARLISDEPDAFWSDGHHIVRCSTTEGLTLFELCASVTKAPAFG